MNNDKKEKNIKVTGQIADSSGHTDFEGSPDEAMELIVEQVKSAGKWAYVNGNPFMFNDISDPNEIQDLRNKLLDSDNPNFVLTGKLQGGRSSVVRSRVISQPISSFFNTKNRPQLAVVFKKNHGKEYVDVVMTDYKGSRKKLSAYRKKIADGITRAFNKRVK